MLKPSSLVLFVLLVSTVSLASAEAACPPVPEVQPSAVMLQDEASKAQDRGFLWRISKDGHTSYLYGTIHVARPEWLVPGRIVMDALRTSDTVALELDMLNENIQRRMAEGMTAMHGEVLPASLQLRLRQQADAMCVPYASIADLTPEFQIAMLSMFVGRWDGLDSSYGIDSVLGGLGHRSAKEVVSLETPEAQLRLLQMSSRQETISFVEEGLEDLETGRARALLGKVAKVWSEADFDEMSRYDEWCECLDSETGRDLMRRLLDVRNSSLSESIDALHAGGKQVFAAVGSLHLFGLKGLPALMEQRGYQVQRMKLENQ